MYSQPSANPTEFHSVQRRFDPEKVYSRRKQPDITTENRFHVLADEDEENVIQLPSQPQSPTPEDIQEVTDLNSNTTNVDYELPYRYNRGKTPDRYKPHEWDRRKCSYPISNYVSLDHLPRRVKGFAANLSAVQVPERVDEAIKDPKWSNAMKQEMEALEKNGTWELVELPKGKKTVGCKWVFSLKYDVNEIIERYKARLVAKGYIQTYGIDYQETFSPVVKLNTVRVLLSLAANLDWPLHQFDVKNAFLYGDLEEEIYMDVPPGYEVDSYKSMVCRLKRSLYGLKQSPHAWFGRFSNAMKSYGYQQSDSDHTLFLKHNQGKVTVLIIYVDDMVITGDDLMEIQTLEKRLSKEFDMKNLGGLKYFLGIEVTRSKQDIVLSQRKYVLDLLTEVGMLDCKPADTPAVQNLKLGNYPNQTPTNKERYQKLVGKLIYLSHTRPDIAYAVSMVSQFMQSPSEAHMEAVNRILRYLKGSPGRGLQFMKHGHLKMSGYTDADWTGNVTDRKSMDGYFTFVGDNLVTWRNKKQNVVALSSAEAEFRGMSKGLCELLWLRKLMTELGYAPQEEMDQSSN
jgi:Reverse transcriptase (RNA-dependent DNA polymerase)